jgi:hypothetical protein
LSRATITVNLEFSETRRRAGDYPYDLSDLSVKACLMPTLFLMQSVLRAVSAVVGGFGVFYLIMSWSAPALCGLALLLLGAASAITYFLDR